MEILKSGIFTLIGVVIGCILFSAMPIPLKAIFCIAMVCVWLAALFLFLIFGKDKKKNQRYERQSALPNQGARISRNAQSMQNNTNFSSAPAPAPAAQPQSNPLDRKPMSAEKKEQYEKNKQPARKIVLLNEEGTALMEWSLQKQTSLIIGKGSDKEPVDIDLAGSAVAQMISKQHAVLNYTDKGWFIDDIDSKNGTRVKKASQNSIMDVKLVGAIEVEKGDIIYIASTMLQIQ